MDLATLKNIVKSRNTNNMKFVKIRAPRFCEHCCKLLTAGTETLTINKKYNGRIWLCIDCVILRLNIINARAFKASIAFGDEGGYMTAQEWEDEVLAEWEDIDY